MKSKWKKLMFILICSFKIMNTVHIFLYAWDICIFPVHLLYPFFSIDFFLLFLKSSLYIKEISFLSPVFYLEIFYSLSFECFYIHMKHLYFKQ